MTIRINGVAASEAFVPYGQTVSLSLLDTSLAQSLRWEILPPLRDDGVEIDADVCWPAWTVEADGTLSLVQPGPTFPAVTGKPDVYHSYTIRCKETRGGVVQDPPHTAIVRVRDPRTGQALPAAGENLEADPVRGWGPTRANYDAALSRSGGQIRVYNGTGGSLSALRICRIGASVDWRTVGGNANPGGTASQSQKIFSVTVADVEEKQAQKHQYCILPEAIASGAFGWAVVQGDLYGNTSGASLIAGRKVFCDTTGNVQATPNGKTCIEVGTCVDSSTTGHIAVNFVVHKDGAETEPSWFGADEDGLTNDIAAINAACVYATTYRKNKTVRIAGSLQCNTASQTIAAGCTLRFTPGGKITGTGLSTLTINCKLASEGGSDVTPEMFGAVFNGHLITATDDWLPIQTAIKAAASSRQRLRLRADNTGAYLIRQPLLWAADTCPTVKGGSNQLGVVSAYTKIKVDFTPERQGLAAAVGAPSGGVSTVTGLTGMTATDVGSWLYFRNIGTAYQGKRFMQIVAYNNATSVNVANPTSTTGTGQEWYFERRPALDIRSRESRFEGISVENYGFTYNFFFAGVRTATEPGHVMTNCHFKNINVTSNNTTYLAFGFGFHHADNLVQPGAGPWPPNCENNHYEQCHAYAYERAGFYCPSYGGQSKKNILDRCSTGFGYYGIEWNSGSFVCSYADFQGHKEACVKIVSGNLDQCNLIECLSEHCARLLDIGGYTSAAQAVNVIGGRYDCAESLHADGYYIKALGNVVVNLKGVTFQAANAYNAAWKIFADNGEVGNLTGARGAHINLSSCVFPTNEPVYRGTTNHRLTMEDCKGYTSAVGSTAVPIRNEYSWPNNLSGDFGDKHARIGFFGREAVTVSAATYTVKPNDQILLVSRTATGACTLTLPLVPYDGEEHVVKDTGALAGTNFITVNGNGKNIDGSATVVLAVNRGVFTIRYDGASTQWHVL